MDDQRPTTWEILFQRALILIDDARSKDIPVDEWTFGGGTVLMRRHWHRRSRDVDIFIDDPQFIGYLSPRLSPVAESLTSVYSEDSNFVKLNFPEGEIDFVVAPPITAAPAKREMLLGRSFLVETSAEIMAKKIWHRGADITVRDIFDFAMVAEWEPEAMTEIAQVLQDRRGPILKRVQIQEHSLRERFESLEILEYRRSFDECVQILEATLRAA
jgi:hypothetical protein